MEPHIQKLFDRITHTSMRVSILSLFLSITLIAFSTTLGFLYYKNYHAISKLSKRTIEQSSGRILESVDDLFAETQRLVEGNSLLLKERTAITPKNEWLHSYMLEMLQYYPSVPYLFIGTIDGDYIEVGNLAVSVQTHYLSNPSKLLPKEAVYEWQYYTRSGDKVEGMNYYYDKDFKEIASEDASQINYDPRERPWYQQAVKAGRFSWTDVYKFFDTGDPGITASVPLYSKEGSFIGVLGADLSFRFLSKFFAKQKIGKTGKPFIIDTLSGDIIIPESSLITSSTIAKDTVLAGYELYRKTKERDFPFKSNGVRYLAHMEPIQMQTDWLISIIVPFDDFFGELEKNQMEAFLIVLLICLLSSVVIVYFAKRLSAPIVALSKAIDKIQHLDLASEERILSNIKEICLMNSSVYSMRLAFRSFIHYVPKEIVKQLLSQNKEIALGGEKKEVTILFSDIADFTSITEAQPTEILMPLLAEYFDGLSKIILQAQGTIDKYIGDSIMAFWGAPLDMPNHVAACAEAALLCNAFVNDLNQQREKEKKPPFLTRFGINTGTVIVGNIGTRERMNYTLIGDTVNSASRLQQVNKIYHTKILISKQVVQSLGEQFLVRPLDMVEVKGKKQKITIYELIGKKDGPEQIRPASKDIALCGQFEKAYEAFYANDLPLAKKLFEAIHKEFPDDGPTEIYLGRVSDKGG